MPARRQPCCGLCPKGERLIDEDQDGPRSHSERFCTDRLCLLPLLLTLVLLGAIGQLAVETGDPTSIRYGTDHLGRRCGVGELEQEPKIFFPKLGTELVAQQELLATPWKLQLFGVCVPECPQRGSGDIYEVGGSEGYAVSLSTQSVMNRCLPVEEESTTQDVVCVEPACTELGWGASVECIGVAGHEGAWRMATAEQEAQCTRQLEVKVQERYSLPGSGELLQPLAAAVGGAGSAAAAVSAARGEVLLCGVLLAIAMGVFWLLFLRFCARFTVYLLLLTTLLVLVLATALCTVKAGVLSDEQLAALSSQANSAMEQYSAQVAHAGVSDAQVQQVHQALTEVTSAADAADVVYFRWGAAALALVSALYLALLLALRSTIGTVVAIVTEATVAVGAIPVLLPFPLTTLAALLAVYAYAGVVAVYLLTAAPTVADVAVLQEEWEDAVEGAVNATFGLVGDAMGAAAAATPPLQLELGTPPTLSEGNIDFAGAELLPEVGADELRTGLLLFHVFGVLWLAQLVQAVGYAAMSGAVSHWFFFRDVPSERQTFPLAAALYRAVRYHLGSLAFGALLVAVVQFLRVVLEWFDQQSKKLQQGSETAKLAIKCTKCCLWCLEKCLRFITGYAYIFIALNGDTFCTACHDTFRLLTAYPAQALVNQLVQSLLFAVQSLLLPVLCALATYRLVELDALPGWALHAQATVDDAAHAASERVQTSFDLSEGAQGYVVALATGVSGALDASIALLGVGERSANEDPVDPVWPALAALLLAFFVARSFASVYECVVDTLFVCAMRDKDEYGASHMSDSLRDALGLEEKAERAAPSQADESRAGAAGDTAHV